MSHARREDRADFGDALAQLFHRPSHEELMTPVAGAANGATVDAIIIPTARPADHLSHAASLATELGCPVLALCSRDADRNAAVRVASEYRADMVAVDVTGVRLPFLLTAGAVAHEVAPGTKYVDLSLKRNLGLLVAHMRGWSSVLFLDDDIRDVKPHEVRAAAAQLSGFTAIGFRIEGSADGRAVSQYDNSVVCHAYRDVGGDQKTFIGGGAMVAPITESTSFFPDVYNEDWFFFLDGESLGRVGRLGSLTQGVYDPYDDPQRARDQEFGDCLAEGVFALLHDRKPATAADEEYWTDCLVRRRALIDLVAAREPTFSDGERRARRIASLDASRETLDRIRPHHFIRFLDAWRADRKEWSAFVGRLSREDTEIAALAHLGVRAVSTTQGHQG